MTTPSNTEVDIRVVDLADIETNAYNPNAMEQEAFDLLTEHIKAEGKMVQPILVRKNPNAEGPPFMVVDGEHRFRASVAAGLKQAVVVVVDYDEDTAKMRTISFNQLRGNYIPLKMAHLLVSLEKNYSQEEIRRMTGIKKEEFKTLSELLKMPDIDFDDTPEISLASVERPTQVTLLLMPNEHSEYHAAMVKAMTLAGNMVVPLVGAEVGQYDKAMTKAMDVTGTKLRNVALASICKVFNNLPADQQLAMLTSLFPKQD